MQDIVPYYRVLLHGTRIQILSADASDPPIVGFYATRIVRGVSEQDAVQRAKARVSAEWSTPQYAETNLGGLPVLEVEWVGRTTFLDRMTFSNKGHVFYPADEDLPNAAEN